MRRASFLRDVIAAHTIASPPIADALNDRLGDVGSRRRLAPDECYARISIMSSSPTPEPLSARSCSSPGGGEHEPIQDEEPEDECDEVRRDVHRLDENAELNSVQFQRTRGHVGGVAHLRQDHADHQRN